MRLINQSRKNLVLADKIQVASTFKERLVGLLGKSSLPPNECLWIRDCRSIHTAFMKFRIDAVFVDKGLTVRKVCFDIPKWRLIWPVSKANSVFEFRAGRVTPDNVAKGDTLYVGS